MGFLLLFDFTLPLENPVLLFALLLFIILFAPILLNKLRIPHLIGLIIAGAIIGPNGFNLMLRDSSIILFGTVGLLYIMFLAGIEMDLADFRKNRNRSLVFGMYTFIIPMILGILTGYYVLHFSMMTSVLLASMFASHTLIAYPIISKFGVAKNRAVNITVGGTLVTDTLALLVLAAIVGMATGEVNNMFWIKMSFFVVVFASIVLFIFPIIGRWFFKRYDDNISQFIFVLALMFLGAFLAEAAGIEAIIGAFLVGITLNRLIPATSPLMNRVVFVGNALFIPFFLIGVGMLIDYRIFFKGFETIKVALVMIVVATLAKFLAAWATQKTYKLSLDERRIIFGLSNAQAAATLAAVLIGYNIILNQQEVDSAALVGTVVEPIRLLNESVLNGTILMILVTCTIASFIAQKGAKNIALSELSNVNNQEEDNAENILIPVNKLAIVEEQVQLALTVKSRNNTARLFALNVVDNSISGTAPAIQARKILNKALTVASAADVHMHELLRYDINPVNGIASVVKEHSITDMILGLDPLKGITTHFMGNLNEGILTKWNATTLIYKPYQPLATIKRHLVIVPDHAEIEIGFPFWLIKVWNLSRNTGAKLIFYTSKQTGKFIQDIHSSHPVPCEFIVFEEWQDFLVLSKEVKPNDNLIIVLSRRERPSFQNVMTKIPSYLNKYFQTCSFILIFPAQSGVQGLSVVDYMNPSVLEPFVNFEEIGRTISNLFRRR